MHEDEKIDELLGRWKDDFEPDKDLPARVRSTLGQQREREVESGSLLAWISNALSRPVLAAGFAAVFVLIGMGVSQLLSGVFGEGRGELTLSYRLSIDPLYRLQAMAGAEEFANQPIAPAYHDSEQKAPVLLAGLGWLQGELDLSEPQYEKVRALHGDYEAAFAELFAELLESHRAYRSFDRQRMDSDVIDYFELYELLQNQRQLSERSARLTEELLGKVEGLIEPEQRTRYRALLDKVYPGFSRSEMSKTDA